MINKIPSRFRMIIKRLPVLLCLIIVPACTLSGLGEPSKPLHFYSIGPITTGSDSEQKSDQSTDPNTGVALSVKEFQGLGIYQEKPILWRDDQHLQRFQFNRWANPPAQMLQNSVIELLRRNSGKHISWVYNASTENYSSSFAVEGTLQHLYLSRENENWTLVLHLDLRLIKRDPDQAVSPVSVPGRNLLGRWSLSAEGSTSAPSNESQTPAAMNKLINSLNRNLSTSGSRIAKQILKRVNEHVSTGEQEKKNTEKGNEQK